MAAYCQTDTMGPIDSLMLVASIGCGKRIGVATANVAARVGMMAIFVFFIGPLAPLLWKRSIAKIARFKLND